MIWRIGQTIFPLVLLGIRSDLKPDLDCSAAELVFGATVRLPGEMTSPTPRGAVEDPTSLLHCLRQFMRTLSPVPTGSSTSPFYLEKDLATCSHVYLRCDRVRRPLEPPYDGPFRVLSRGPKTFRIQRDNREEVVSVDRHKTSVRDFLSDEPCGPPPSGLPNSTDHPRRVGRFSTVPYFPTSPLSATLNCHLNTTATGRIHSSTDSVYITCSGRHVYFPDQLVTHFFWTCTHPSASFPPPSGYEEGYCAEAPDCLVFTYMFAIELAVYLNGGNSAQCDARGMCWTIRSLDIHKSFPGLISIAWDWQSCPSRLQHGQYQDKINYYAEVLNSIMPDLQFTMEEEVEDKLPFLDVLVCRQPNGELATSVSRKPTNTLQILSYNSNHPPQHKRSCVRTLYRRVETHCSTPAAKLNEIKLLRELFRANGYPRAFIERSRRQPKKRNEEHSQPNSWRSIPFIKGVSEVVARSLAPLGIGVAHRPDSTIRRQVMRPKDPIPKQEMSVVVYRLQCSCGSCNYVGETGRRLQTRMREHKLAVRRLDPKSEIATHAAQMGHIFNFDAVEIVGRGADHTARQVQEAWMSTDRSVNRHINLPPPYLTLRTFLAGDSHGAGQSGPSVITAADGGDSGHGDMRVGCSHTGGIGGSRIGQRAP
nr:unnamed protein product [Spirometra erinaceieuropaei]